MGEVSEKCNLAKGRYTKIVRYILTVPKQKLGLSDDKTVEIFDFRILPEELEALVDYKTYFPGYHMNKKHWCTIILDGIVPFEEICRRIDASYLLAIK